MIRKVHLEDNKRLLELFLKLDKETKFMMYEEGERETTESETEKRILNILTSGSMIFLNEEKNKINGFLLVQRGIPNRIKHTADIVIGVLKEASNQGIGKKLFEEAFEWAEINQIRRFNLTVIIDNDVAITLYEKMGFELEGRRVESMLVDGQYVDEYYMSKKIGR